MPSKEDSLFIRYIVKDTKYRDYSLAELLRVRERMYKDSTSSKYDKALVQYHIMRLDGRLPPLDANS